MGKILKIFNVAYEPTSGSIEETTWGNTHLNHKVLEI